LSRSMSSMLPDYQTDHRAAAPVSKSLQTLAVAEWATTSDLQAATGQGAIEKSAAGTHDSQADSDDDDFHEVEGPRPGVMNGRLVSLRMSE